MADTNYQYIINFPSLTSRSVRLYDEVQLTIQREIVFQEQKSESEAV